jgi:hypothetical protein
MLLLKGLLISLQSTTNVYKLFYNLFEVLYALSKPFIEFEAQSSKIKCYIDDSPICLNKWYPICFPFIYNILNGGY